MNPPNASPSVAWPDPQREAVWRAALAPLCAEAGLPAPEGPAIAARAPFDAVVADLAA